MSEKTKVETSAGYGLDPERIAKENAAHAITRRKFLRRSGGITLAVTMGGAVAPSLLRAYSSGK